LFACLPCLPCLLAGLFVCLFVCLLACLFVCLFVCLLACLLARSLPRSLACLFVALLVRAFVHLLTGSLVCLLACDMFVCLLVDVTPQTLSLSLNRTKEKYISLYIYMYIYIYILSHSHSKQIGATLLKMHNRGWNKKHFCIKNAPMWAPGHKIFVLLLLPCPMHKGCSPTSRGALGVMAWSGSQASTKLLLQTTFRNLPQNSTRAVRKKQISTIMTAWAPSKKWPRR